MGILEEKHRVPCKLECLHQRYFTGRCCHLRWRTIGDRELNSLIFSRQRRTRATIVQLVRMLPLLVLSTVSYAPGLQLVRKLDRQSL